MADTTTTAPAPEPEPVETVQFGLWWPAGDPGQLRAAADAWQAMAESLEQTSSGLDSAVSAVAESNSGGAIDAFAARWARCGGGSGALPTAAGYCRDMAASLREFADAIDEVREEILRLAAEIAASVAIGVGLAVFTAGLSAAAVTATTARIVAIAARLGVSLGLRAATIVARVAVVSSFGAVESMAADTVIQLGGNAIFNENNNPLDGFSLDQVWASGATGFVAGAPVAGVSTVRTLDRGGRRLQGTIGESVSAATVRMRGGTVLGREVTMDTASKRVRPDLFVRDADGGLRFVDAKTGPGARLTDNQRIGYPELRSGGGTPRGGNAERAGLRSGVPIGPQRVDIERWKW